MTWGRDNRGAMLRVLGRRRRCRRRGSRTGSASRRANPYLYIAAQIHAGLDGLARGLAPPPATAAPYAEVDAAAARRLPASLGEALDALAADERARRRVRRDRSSPGSTQVKRSELARHDQADDKDAWQAREYFSRF